MWQHKNDIFLFLNRLLRKFRRLILCCKIFTACWKRIRYCTWLCNQLSFSCTAFFATSWKSFRNPFVNICLKQNVFQMRFAIISLGAQQTQTRSLPARAPPHLFQVRKNYFLKCFQYYSIPVFFIIHVLFRYLNIFSCFEFLQNASWRHRLRLWKPLQVGFSR